MIYYNGRMKLEEFDIRYMYFYRAGRKGSGERMNKDIIQEALERIGIKQQPDKPNGNTCACGRKLEYLKRKFSGRTVWILESCHRCKEKERRERICQAERRRRQKTQNTDDQIAIGIPEKYHGASFSDMGDVKDDRGRSMGEKVRVHYEKYLKKLRHGLMTFQGKPGRGKTRMLYAILRQAYLDDVKCRYIVVPDLAKQFQVMAYTNLAEEYKMLTSLKKFDGILLLDDLGAEKTTEFVLQDLYILLEYRERWGLITFIATNCTEGELLEKMDQRIMSRLRPGLVKIERRTDRRFSRQKRGTEEINV